MAITITVHTNSWVTLTEANEYLEAKFGAGLWATLSSDVRKQLLISAFWWIYTAYSIAKTSTNENVKNAQIELAWWMYNYYDEYTKRNALQAGGVKEFSLSKWSETFTGKQTLPFVVENFLAGFDTTGAYFPTVERDND